MQISIDLSSVLEKHGDALADDPFLSIELARNGRRLTVHLRVVKRQIIPIAVER